MAIVILSCTIAACPLTVYNVQGNFEKVAGAAHLEYNLLEIMELNFALKISKVHLSIPYAKYKVFLDIENTLI